MQAFSGMRRSSVNKLTVAPSPLSAIRQDNRIIAQNHAAPCVFYTGKWNFSTIYGNPMSVIINELNTLGMCFVVGIGMSNMVLGALSLLLVRKG